MNYATILPIALVALKWAGSLGLGAALLKWVLGALKPDPLHTKFDALNKVGNIVIDAAEDMIRRTFSALVLDKLLAQLSAPGATLESVAAGYLPMLLDALREEIGPVTTRLIAYLSSTNLVSAILAKLGIGGSTQVADKLTTWVLKAFDNVLHDHQIKTDLAADPSTPKVIGELASGRKVVMLASAPVPPSVKVPPSSVTTQPGLPAVAPAAG